MDSKKDQVKMLSKKGEIKRLFPQTGSCCGTPAVIGSCRTATEIFGEIESEQIIQWLKPLLSKENSR